MHDFAPVFFMITLLNNLISKDGEKNIGAHKIQISVWSPIKLLVDFSLLLPHCSAIFAIAIFNAFNLLLNFCIGFVHWFMASLIISSLYTSKYRYINSYRSSSLLKTLAKSKGKRKVQHCNPNNEKNINLIVYQNYFAFWVHQYYFGVLYCMHVTHNDAGTHKISRSFRCVNIVLVMHISKW